MADTALVVMARYPEAGKTKTRLGRTIGDDEATNLYRNFLVDLAQRFASSEHQLLWTYTPAEVDYRAFLASLTPSLVHYMGCFPQQGNDLGARLLHAFQWTHARQFQRTVVIGSDSPHISREIIADAQRALDKVDMVLGPADDGGYYLIGMRKPYDVFSSIPMSTSAVTQMTIELAARQGLLVRLLQPLFDIDELPDLLRLAELLQKDSTLAPATAAYLASKRNLSLYDCTNTSYSHAASLDLHRAYESL